MIRVKKPKKPKNFEKLVGAPGKLHLQRYPMQGEYFRSFWRECIDDLEVAFDSLCGYTAQFTSDGSVDHFLDKHTHRHLAYKWNNYRFASPKVQSKKKPGLVVLDPYKVDDGWFAISLPDLQLYVTDKVPAKHRVVAETMITKLGLVKGRHVMKQRQELYKQYRDGEMSTTAIRRFAPLLAIAIENEIEEGKKTIF